jgi:hypothetical protein
VERAADAAAAATHVGGGTRTAGSIVISIHFIHYTKKFRGIFSGLDSPESVFVSELFLFWIGGFSWPGAVRDGGLSWTLVAHIRCVLLLQVLQANVFGLSDICWFQTRSKPAVLHQEL